MARRGGAKRKKVSREPVACEPTGEAFQHCEFDRAGIAYRRKPVIDSLKERDVLSVRQWTALGRFRDLFDATERSPTRDSCDFSVRGGGDGPTISMMRAREQRYYLERELGSLLPISEAVAGNDITLSQWAIKQSGSNERRVIIDGRLIATYFEAKRSALKIATMDIRMAGERLAAALGA